MKFVGIDTSTRQLTMIFDYEYEIDQEVLDFAKKKLGEDVTVEEMSSYIEELQE